MRRALLSLAVLAACESPTEPPPCFEHWIYDDQGNVVAHYRDRTLEMPISLADDGSMQIGVTMECEQ